MGTDDKRRHIMSAEPKPYWKMSEAEKQAALAPHAIQMAEALEKIALELARHAPAGMTLRRWAGHTLMFPNSMGEKWKAEAAQAVIDALDAIGSGAIL